MISDQMKRLIHYCEYYLEVRDAGANFFGPPVKHDRNAGVRVDVDLLEEQVEKVDAPMVAFLPIDRRLAFVGPLVRVRTRTGGPPNGEDVARHPQCAVGARREWHLHHAAIARVQVPWNQQRQHSDENQQRVGERLPTR